MKLNCFAAAIVLAMLACGGLNFQHGIVAAFDDVPAEQIVVKEEAARAAAVQAVEEKTESDKEATAEKPADAEPAPAPKPVIDPEIIRLELTDGSGISGKLSVKYITVETRYGNLEVPITEIKSFTPGLDSYPQLGAQIGKLIDDLGLEDYNQRESAHKELVKIGLPIRGELQKNLDSDNVERVKHLKAIMTELEQLVDTDDEFGPNKASQWIHDDTVETVNFTVVGKITPNNFEISSKYGPLKVALSDIRRAHRNMGVKEDVRKNLSVEGANLVQRSFKNSSIRVERGDKVSISADGTIVMTPWGGEMTSTPDGGENFGWFVPNQIYSGALVAKIGDSGTVFKVGSKLSFTADRAGTLQFAIAMQAQYARNNFQYPGKYELKIHVEPK